jgi:methionyl-tRNA formyltransferase
VRVAFFGLPLAAWLLHRDGHDIVYAALSRTDTVGRRRVQRVLPHVALRPDVTSGAVREAVARARPDLVVSWFWTTKLPMDIVALAPLGGFGVHPSLLPRHRGPDPYFRAIDAGDRVTGVTAHRIAAEYDVGAILAQRSLAIDPSWNAWTLARKLDRPSLALLREVAQAFARGEPPPEVAQDEAKATLAPAPADEELELDWTWTAEQLARRVRAASPAPGAWAFFGDEVITITDAVPASSVPRVLVPGEACVVDGVAVVRTRDGGLALLKGRMDAAEDEEPHSLGTEDLADMVRELGSLGPGSARSAGEP